MQYRQQIFGERRDVDLVFVDLLDRPWYRQQVSATLRMSSFPQMSGYKFLLLAAQQVPDRPLYVDGNTAAQLGTTAGLEMHGLVWAFKPAVKTQTVNTADTGRLFSSVYSFPHLDAVRGRQWPNLPIQTEFAYAMFRYGLGLAGEQHKADALDALRRALAWEPGNAGIQAAIAQVQQTPAAASQPARSTP
jgi:hypothetical protein